MKKLTKNTIIIIGILLCAIVVILNICVSAEISNNLEEKVKITINSPIKLLIIGILIILIYLIINRIKKIKISKKRKKDSINYYFNNIRFITNSMDKHKSSHASK